LVRKTQGKAIVFLMDEAQDLNFVDKRKIEIHHALLQLASDYNQDVGFVIAYFGTGQQAIPAVISQPDDILSRLGVTRQNINEAFINLKDLINSPNDMRSFIGNLLEGIKDVRKAKDLIAKGNLANNVTWQSLPFTQDSIDRAVEILSQSELTRNARMIINALAQVAAVAYHQGKATNQYVIADKTLLDSAMPRV